MTLLAITHVPSPHLIRCELTFSDRRPIDVARAEQQHLAYCRTLERCGAHVVRLTDNRELPDCAFVEDAAVVLDELAIIGAMGVASRQPEIPLVEQTLSAYRPLRRVRPPATLEGGDVLRVGRTLLVGGSCRTNAAGCAALADFVKPFGYDVIRVPVRRCLHLKTACTALDDRTLLINRDWVNPAGLEPFTQIRIPESEPWAANVLRIRDRICVAADCERTASLLDELGYLVERMDVSEFAKAEAGVTCLSLLVEGV